MAGQESSVISKEIEVPQYDGALHSALVAHSTFRRIGDEEGTEAALQMVKEIRHRQEGSEGGLVKDTPRPRPLPPAFTSQQSSAMVNPYHELVGGRQIPFQTGLPTPPPETVELEVVKSRPTPEIKQLEAPMEESSPKAKPIILRSALANLENWDHRFDRKAWHNVKATMSGLWEYPDMSRPESNVLMNAEFVNGWLEDLLAQGELADR